MKVDKEEKTLGDKLWATFLFQNLQVDYTMLKTHYVHVKGIQIYVSNY